MKILIDTNVLMDVLAKRGDFFADSARVWKCCESGKIDGYISALSIPNIVYIMRKELDPQRIQQLVEQITMIFKVVDLRESDLKDAAGSFSDDYEDALHISQAKRIRADHIITRNVRHFENSTVSVLTPSQLIEKL